MRQSWRDGACTGHPAFRHAPRLLQGRRARPGALEHALSTRRRGHVQRRPGRAAGRGSPLAAADTSVNICFSRLAAAAEARCEAGLAAAEAERCDHAVATAKWMPIKFRRTPWHPQSLSVWRTPWPTCRLPPPKFGLLRPSSIVATGNA